MWPGEIPWEQHCREKAKQSSFWKVGQPRICVEKCYTRDFRLVMERISDGIRYPTISDYIWDIRIRLFTVKYISEPIRIRLSLIFGQILCKSLGIRMNYSTFLGIRIRLFYFLDYPILSESDILLSENIRIPLFWYPLHH